MKPGVWVHAVDANEHEVDVDGSERGDREWADERVRRRPDAAGQDDRLVGPTHLVEHVGDANGVRQDGQPRNVRQPLSERVGRSPGRHRDRHPGLDECHGGIRDRVLLALLKSGFRGKSGLEEGAAGHGRRAAVDLLK